MRPKTESLDRESARRLAFLVNATLEEYIGVHDDVFKFSLWRIIPFPGLVDRAAFASNALRLKRLMLQLNKIEQELDGSNCYSNRAVEEFGTALKKYVLALADAVSQLRLICERLHEESHRIFSYAWKKYKRDVDQYKFYIDAYLSLARRLNELYDRL